MLSLDLKLDLSACGLSVPAATQHRPGTSSVPQGRGAGHASARCGWPAEAASQGTWHHMG